MQKLIALKIRIRARKKNETVQTRALEKELIIKNYAKLYEEDAAHSSATHKNISQKTRQPPLYLIYRRHRN